MTIRFRQYCSHYGKVKQPCGEINKKVYFQNCIIIRVKKKMWLPSHSCNHIRDETTEEATVHLPTLHCLDTLILCIFTKGSGYCLKSQSS